MRDEGQKVGHRLTFQIWIRMEMNAGMVTNRDVLESKRKRKMMIWERRSVMRERTERPARLVLCCQKAMSDWKARNSKRRWRVDAKMVTPRRYMEVSEINLEDSE